MPPGLIRGIPILARTAGLIAHLMEEAETPIGFLLASKGEEAIAAHGRGLGSRADADGRARDRERALGEPGAAQTRRSISQQIEYLFERSRFYRDKLERARALRRTEQSAASTRSKALPLTEKDELRASRSAEEPIGAHLHGDARRDRAHLFDQRHDRERRATFRLTAGDLEVWVRTSARSYAASGIVRGERLVSTYNAGPFVAGAALGAFDRLGLCHIPVGSGNTERLMTAIELLKPTVAVADARPMRCISPNGRASAAWISPAPA